MTSAKTTLRSRDSQRLVWQVGIAVSVAVLVTWSAYACWSWWRATSAPAGATSESTSGQSIGDADAGSRTDVQLTPEKVQEAKLKLATAEFRPIRETSIVPGEVDYNGAKHLDVTASVAGVVKRVLAEPGQMVHQGDPLVVMSSAEVGLARVEIHSRVADLELATREDDWALQVAENVEQLLKLLPARPKLAELEKQLVDRPLGDYREKLMSTYSKLVFAEFAAAIGDLEEHGGIARRVIEEHRRSNREIAAAAFQSACETARFDATHAHLKALAGRMQAARLLSVSRERLATLLGPQADVANLPSDAELSEFVLLAPFAGRIEERQAVVSARIKMGDSLFTMADTTTLWVKAEIHERDWKSLQFSTSGSISIRVPALDDAVFATRVQFVGARVSPVSRSVPLVTELSNQQGLFKPGMFVWVEVPLEEEREALVVPSGAVTRHEGRAFVFVPLGAAQYRRVDVETGLESGGLIEIQSGLKRGQEVVEQGVFDLKSELLLEREVE